MIYADWIGLTMYAKAALVTSVEGVTSQQVSVGGRRWIAHLLTMPTGVSKFIAATPAVAGDTVSVVEVFERATGRFEFRTTGYTNRRTDDAAMLVREAMLATSSVADLVTYVGSRSWRCGICGKPLKDQLSADLGIGPECRKRHGELMVAIMAKHKAEDWNDFQKSLENACMISKVVV